MADCGEGECCGTVEGVGNECLKYLEAGQQCAHHATHPVNLISKSILYSLEHFGF